METFKGIILTILSVFVVRTLTVNTIQKLRRIDKRLAYLEMQSIKQNIDAELKFDDVFQAIKTLNQSHCDVPMHVESDARLGMDHFSNIDADTTSNDVRDAIARFQRGFKEEKLERKLTIASMKREMKTVEDDLRKTVKAELLKVNEAIESDRNRTNGISTQLDKMQSSIDDTIGSVVNINDSLDMTLTTIREHLQEVKKSAAHNEDMIARMDESIVGLRHGTDTLRQVIACKSVGFELHEWNDHWYIVVKTEKTYDDAIANCRRCNTHLVDIHSEEEKDFVLSIGGSFFWIGLNDRNEEGVWAWHHNNKRASYFNWYDPDPDWLKEDNHCVIGSGLAEGQWYDMLCNSTMESVCKI